MNFDSDTNVVEVAVRRLRAKLDDPFPTKLLHTVRGMGYVLEDRCVNGPPARIRSARRLSRKLAVVTMLIARRCCSLGAWLSVKMLIEGEERRGAAVLRQRHRADPRPGAEERRRAGLPGARACRRADARQHAAGAVARRRPAALRRPEPTARTRCPSTRAASTSRSQAPAAGRRPAEGALHGRLLRAMPTFGRNWPGVLVVVITLAGRRAGGAGQPLARAARPAAAARPGRADARHLARAARPAPGAGRPGRGTAALDRAVQRADGAARRRRTRSSRASTPTWRTNCARRWPR